MATPLIYVKLGQRIRYLREQRGLSQEKLALEAGLNRTYVSGIELGKKRPTLLTLEKLVCVLGVSLKMLFD